MTIQNAFHNWQSAPLQPDPNRCSPLNTTLNGYLLDRWGGQNLGCYSARPVVGGSSPSSHGSGAANDWRYQDPGPGRQVLFDEILPWLIDNSLELGVQAIHDYVGCRIWRPPGCSGRPPAPAPDCGWKPQTPGSQMGQPWALWIHVEVLDTRWGDTRSVDQMLDQGGFLMALSDQQQQDIYDRVMGSLPGPYSEEQRPPAPEPRNYVLDNADGDYIVSLLQEILAKIA